MKMTSPFTTHLGIVDLSNNVNTPTFLKTPAHKALIVAGFALGLGLGTATAIAASDEAAMPVPHSDSVSAVITDSVITAKVKAKLMNEDALKKSDIDVITTNGVVTLKGTARNSNAKEVAEAMTKSVEGVKTVDNELKTPGSSKTVAKAERVTSDSWITTKVKSEIFADSVSKGFDVGVETLNGVVLLEGKLANRDAIDHVKHIASKVKGVKSVDASAMSVSND